MTPDQMRRAAYLLDLWVSVFVPERMESEALAFNLRVHADEIEQRENFAKQEKD